MPVLFSDTDTKKTPTVPSVLPEPIRGSIFLLLSRIFLVLVGTDIVYLTVRVFVFEQQPPWLNDVITFIIFFIFLLCSYILQIFLIYSVLLHWLNRKYYFETTHLIVRKGIFKTTERIYDLTNLKSVVVTQGILGKIFHYGTISIEITSPGLTEEADLTEIPHPHKIEMQIKKFL
jgi:uncharacterized membrane protein YdbT with pleckstrin-like domain